MSLERGALTSLPPPGRSTEPQTSPSIPGSFLWGLTPLWAGTPSTCPDWVDTRGHRLQVPKEQSSPVKPRAVGSGRVTVRSEARPDQQVGLGGRGQ